MEWLCCFSHVECVMFCHVKRNYMGEMFLPHGGIPLLENCQVRKSLSCTFETLVAACIFASRVPGESLNLLYKMKSQGRGVGGGGGEASHLHLPGASSSLGPEPRFPYFEVFTSFAHVAVVSHWMMSFFPAFGLPFVLCEQTDFLSLWWS